MRCAEGPKLYFSDLPEFRFGFLCGKLVRFEDNDSNSRNYWIPWIECCCYFFCFCIIKIKSKCHIYFGHGHSILRKIDFHLITRFILSFRCHIVGRARSKNFMIHFNGDGSFICFYSTQRGQLRISYDTFKMIAHFSSSKATLSMCFLLVVSSK